MDKNFIAVISSAAGKITKAQDFDTEADAIAHVGQHGGFVVPNPGGRFPYWVVNADAKTVVYDKSIYDADEQGRLANLYKMKRAEAYPAIGDQLDMMYHDLVDGTRTWRDAIAKVKSDNPKPGD